LKLWANFFARQIIGARMATLACQMLVTFVEIDRCATDAICLVTGCKLGRRALKFRDWGKMAATFLNLSTGKAVRIVARENSRELARQRFPEVEGKSRKQSLAYRELLDAELFKVTWVAVELPPRELPGYKGERVT